MTELKARGAVWAVKHFRPYLYGHKCQLYTDHEALKSLMNTPHPSWKLARWGLVLQEVDFNIHYCPGKRNANTDALLRSPMPQGANFTPGSDVFGIVSALHVPQVPAKDGDTDLGALQRGDPELQEIMDFVQNRTLPGKERRARELVLASARLSMW